MTIERPFIRILNFLARVLGVIWMLAGALFVFSAFVAQTNQLLFAGIGIFLLAAGTALLAAKAVTPADSIRVQRFVDRIKGRHAE